jgi:hypothetical protein
MPKRARSVRTFSHSPSGLPMVVMVKLVQGHLDFLASCSFAAVGFCASFSTAVRDSRLILLARGSDEANTAVERVSSRPDISSP